MAVQHLISNKGRHAHAACDRRVSARLVERVGEVTCKRCLAVLETLRTAMARVEYNESSGKYVMRARRADDTWWCYRCGGRHSYRAGRCPVPWALRLR